jgi:predicted Zn-dependent protease
MDRPRQALHAARAALRVTAPGDGVARDLAEAHLRLGQPEQARLVLRRYVLERPGDPQGYLLLARSFEDTGEVEAARSQARLAAAAASLEAGRGSADHRSSHRKA